MTTPKTALYRHYNVDGELLYVGISVSTMKRLGEHKKSPWVHDITRIEIQYFDDREEARKAEMNVIKSERPQFNKAHKPKPISETEAIFAEIYNAKEGELGDKAIYFQTYEVGMAFIQEYWKYIDRMKRLNRRKDKTNAHLALVG